MRATAMFALLPAMLLAAACSGDERAALDDELKKDLALAASDGLEMAPVVRTNAIAADEVGPLVATPKPQTRKAPRKGTARPQRVVVEPTVVEAEATEIAMVPVPTPTVAAESPPTTTEPEPIATPRPRPISIGVVVIRGGIVGDDHCDPRTDGRRARGPRIGGPSSYPGTIVRGIPDDIPITPMVPRAGVPATRGGIAINERLPERATGGRMAVPRY